MASILRAKVDLGSIDLWGDSLSVTHVGTKPVTTPGSALAFNLAELGHKVRVDAIGGFALQYFRPEAAHTKQGLQAQRMIERTKESAPDTLLVMMGTNDYLDNPKALRSGIAAIVGAFSGAGVQPRLIFIGPPSFSASAKGGALSVGTARVYEALGRSLRPVIDTRSITADLLEPPLRAKDRIHFSPKGARLFAGRLVKLLKGRETVRQGSAFRNLSIGDVLTVVGLVDLVIGGPLSNWLWGKKKRKR